MAASNKSHLAAVLSVDVAEVSEDGLKRVREAFTSAGDWWFLWPAVVMAYVLALSALKVFGLDSVLGDD